MSKINNMGVEASDAVRNQALDDAEEAVVTLYESDDPVYLPDIALAIRALKTQPDQGAVDREQNAADAQPWIDLFWSVAKELNCLPSSFVDGNEHVLRAARQAQAALSSPQEPPCSPTSSTGASQ